MKRLFILLLLVSLSSFTSALYLWQTPTNWQSITSFKTFLDLCLIDYQTIKDLDELNEAKTVVIALSEPLAASDLEKLEAFLDQGGQILIYPQKEAHNSLDSFLSHFQVSPEVNQTSLVFYSRLASNGFYFNEDVTATILSDHTKEQLLACIKILEPESLQPAQAFIKRRLLEIKEIINDTLNNEPDLVSLPNPSRDKCKDDLLELLKKAQLTAELGQVWKLSSLKLEALEKAELYQATFYESLPVETRGIWISTKAIPKAAEGIGEMVKAIAAAGFNVIFPEVFAHGYTLFPSEVANDYGIEKQNPAYKTWDPLEALAKEAKKYNIEIHAWFSVCYVGFGEPGPLLTKYPAWAAVNNDGSWGYSRGGNHLYFASPLNEEFRDYVTSLMKEAVTKYDLDGIHLDYIRFSGMDVPDTDYSKEAVAGFIKRYGLQPDEKRTQAPKLWIYYRTSGVDELVHLANEKIRSFDKDIFISAAVAPNGPPSDYQPNYLQNWPLWLEKGYVDFVVPMTYSPNPLNVKGWFNSAVNKAPRFGPVYAGVSAFDLLDRLTLNSQVSVLGRSSGSLGSIFFAYDHFDWHGLNVLKAGVFNQPARPAHHYKPEDWSSLIDFYLQRIHFWAAKSLLPTELVLNFEELPKQFTESTNYDDLVQTINQIKSLNLYLRELKLEEKIQASLLNDLTILENWLAKAVHSGLVTQQSVDSSIERIIASLQNSAPQSIYTTIPKYLYSHKVRGYEFYEEINKLLEQYRYDQNQRENYQLGVLLEELLFLSSFNWPYGQLIKQ